jgi:hypothetical protein
MATHTIKAEPGVVINTYRLPDTAAEKKYTYFNTAEVTVSEEYVGRTCNFSKISSSIGESYVENTFLEKLPETPESAPYVCSNTLPNFNYVEPEWFNLPSNKPFFNEKTLEYSVSITSRFLNFVNQQQMQNDAIDKGIRELLSFYNKQNDEETITQLKNYFIFAKISDTYVPYRPNARVKNLVTVHKKYFDAVAISNTSQEETPFGADSSEANFILRINFTELENLFVNLNRLLKFYNMDIYLANSRIGFNLGTAGTGPFNTSKQLMRELSLNEKSDYVDLFYKELLDLFSLNDIDFLESDNELDKSYVEFAINNRCNKIYDVAVNQNNRCTKLRIGIQTFLRSLPVDDSTVVAFVKNIHQINKIEKCKLPWPEFVETYVYPKVQVRNLSINDILQNFEKNKFEYAKDLLQIFQSIADEGQYYPGMTYQETVEQEKKIALIKKNQIINSFTTNIFARDLFQADNFFSRTSIEKFFNNLQASLDSVSDTSTLRDEKTEFMADFRPSTSPDIGQASYIVVKKENDYYVYDESKKVSYLFNELISKNIVSKIKYTVNGEEFEFEDSVYKLKKVDKKYRNEFYILNKIYDKLNAVGLCRIIDFATGCMLSLVKDFVDIDIQAELAVGAVASLDSSEISKEVIYNLPYEDQQKIFEKLLLETGCLNVKALLYILKRNLPTDQYESLGFSKYETIDVDTTYENLVKEVSKIMSTRAQ